MPGRIRKSRDKPPIVIICIALIILIPLSTLSALGSQEKVEVETKVEKETSVVYICAVDTSLLPPEQQIAGRRIVHSILQLVGQTPERTRTTVESALYRDRLWREQKQSAGKALADAWKERDSLIFKGYSKQKYESELQRVQESIRTLQEKQQYLANNPPLVASTATLMLHKDNQNGTFAAIPADGDKNRFCGERGIDLLINGSLKSFYNRWLFSYEVYRFVDDSILFSDSIAFSPEELDTIFNQVASSLYQVLSGSPTGAVKITTDPGLASIFVNNSFQGRGQTPVLEGPPGTLTVEITDSAFYPVEFSLEREAQSLSTATIVLEPIARSALQIIGPEGQQLRLYINGLYGGAAPLNLTLPNKVNQTKDSLKSLYSLQILAEDGSDSETQPLPLIISAQPGTITISEEMITPKPAHPVEKARKQFYGAFGRFWLALPVAFILNGVADTYSNSYTYSGNSDLLSRATTSYYSAQGAWVLSGLFLLESLYRLGSYVYIANTSSSQVIDPK